MEKTVSKKKTVKKAATKKIEKTPPVKKVATKKAATKKVATKKAVKKEVAAAPPVVLTEAQKLWDKIKDYDLELYALPGQIVSKHFKPLFVEPETLYLQFSGIAAPAALPALEECLYAKYKSGFLSKEYEVDRGDLYVTVKEKRGY